MNSVTKNKLNRETITEIIAYSFPDSEITGLEELTEGMFNTAYLITGTNALEKGVILKIGPADTARVLTYEKDLIRAEVRVYELLKEKSVPAPRLLAYDLSRELVPFHYFLMSRVEGVLWKDADESRLRRSRPALMEELGRINATIHSVTGEKFGYIKDDPHYQFDSWPDAFLGMIQDILADGQRGSCQLPYDDVLQAVTRHRKALACVKEPRLVDFDIWAGNVFLKESGDGYRISGVIDFERCFFGDPYADFTSAINLFKEAGKETDFCRGYNSISSVPVTLGREEEIRMDLYRLYMALIWIVETYRYDDRAYAEGVIRFSQGRIRELLERLL